MKFVRPALLVLVISVSGALSSQGLVSADTPSEQRGPHDLQKLTFSGVFTTPAYDDRTHSFKSVLTLTNQGRTAYSPLTIWIASGDPAIIVAGARSEGESRDHDHEPDEASFRSEVSLPDGALLPGETQTLTVLFEGARRSKPVPKLTAVLGRVAPEGLGIKITAPKSAQIPAGPSFLVAGILTARGVAGASVEGVPACLSGSTFFVNAFRPQPSDTTVTAIATDIDGGSQSSVVSITANSKGLRVEPSPACGGIAPLTTTVNVSLDATDGDTIASETIDFGEGAAPSSVPPGTPVQNIYSNPGLYAVTVTCTTTLGATLHQSALVSIQTPAQAFAPVQANVSLLQSALSSHNILRALNYHTDSSQSRYAPLLTQSGINLPGLAALLSTAQPRVIVGDYAEMVVSMSDATGIQSSSVVLIRGGDGLWRIDSW